MMIEAFGYEFFRNALLAGLLASIVCGTIGSYIVVRHMVAIAGGISHAAFGGIGLGYLLGIDPLLGAFGFTIAIAFGIWALLERAEQHIDTLIGAIWSGGMAFGILCIALSPGYTPDLFSYLFGNILLVSWGYILPIGALCLILLITISYLYIGLQAVAFDPEYAKILGIHTRAYNLLFLILIAIAIVVLIKVVGTILIIALLSLPPSIAREYVETLKGMICLSVVLGIGLTTGGIFLSYALDIPSGATIILLAVFAYLVALVERKGIGGLKG